MGKQMPKNREINRVSIKRKATIMVTALRAHWLKQLLDWPLKDGPLADRLTKAEVAALSNAAKQGKLFCGSLG
jgi:hypothetical protein